MRYPFLTFVTALALVTPLQARAQADTANESRSGWFGMTLGADYTYGQIGNDDRGIVDRDMTAFGLKALPGVRLGNSWLVGLDLNYVFQQQQTSLSKAGNVNWAGEGYQLGIGAQFYPNEAWALQAAVDFVGEYDFKRDTAAGQNDNLKEPVSLKAKAQYFFKPGLPLSLDAVAGYTMWNTLHVGGVDYSEKSNQWVVGLGLTYHFGRAPRMVASEAAASPAAQPTPSVAPVPAPVVTNEEAPASNGAPSSTADKSVITTEKTATGSKINIASAAFASGSAEISGEFRETLMVAAKGVAAGAVKKITVQGYTDSSGSAKLNQRLSEKRAANVKAILVEAGIPSEKIESTGLGSKNPIASNATVEGKEKNRRVEIAVEN